ncbi:hypothetical protein [Arcobacter sp. LA11]|uniref:hypothetical protein n=1 Tax=Arcobacter sp. LA11 TaxID=1898176 RepID=UPI0009338DA5|nr:hypothetical protein [Arcobacter sp. LA11]
MKNLIVYGSLINKKELLKEGILLKDVEFVKVYGFRRVFNQEPSYRFVDSINRAVLNVEEEEEFWFNALVIKNLSDQYFETLDKREKGYDRFFLDEKSVRTYDDTIILNCVLYKGKFQKKNSEILPNFDYLKICLDGIESFGKSYLDDFLKTTYKNSKEGLVLI